MIRNGYFFVMAVLCLSLNSVKAFAQTGVSFDGINDFVAFGPAAGLNSSSFTIEAWFKREGTGSAANTGTGGVVAIPLVAKGRAEAEGSNRDMNYFLGIDAVTKVLVADLEEGSGQPNPGTNHPVFGITPICNNVWYHAAATFNGITWRLYLNGVLETALSVITQPQTGSIQHASIGTALNSTGVPSGYFKGLMDEVRIWNNALTVSTILSNMGQQIPSASGLIGRWGLNEGSGLTAANTGSTSVNGTLVNGVTWKPGSPFSVISSSGNASLFMGGTNAYVTFGNNTSLGLSQFTLETWFKKTGSGSTASTGSGGVVAIPLISKGSNESENSNRDINYFLGIDPSSGKVVGDFEEGSSSSNPGLNHPINGITTINNNTWYHAALSYNGSILRLYVNGALENSITINRTAQSASIGHAALGTTLSSTGTASGFFEGYMDEARVWNIGRTLSAVQSTINTELNYSQPNMVARWGLNESCGIIARDSSGNTINGSVAGVNWYWNAGGPLNAVFVNYPPSQPNVISPSNGSSNVSRNPNLQVSVNDPESGVMSVSFYARPCPPSPGPDFTIVGIPDTQYYTSELNGGTNAMYKSQMNWVVSNRVAENIVFVEGLGDCVQNGDNVLNEWRRVDTACKIIENPVTTSLPEGIPYGMNVGNHDQTPISNPNGTTALFNQFFGSSRFSGRNYYGGHYGSNNNNNYCLFSAGDLDFIVINMEYNPNPPIAVLNWANNLLQTYPNRRAIVGSHALLDINGNFGPQGLFVYNTLKINPNLFLILTAHVSGEASRSDVFSGHRTYTWLANYQSRSNGGSGWMRLMRFSPANNTISVRTYSPWLNQYETDGNSQFTVNYDMSVAATGFTLLGTNTNVTSGSVTSFPYTSLAANTCYQWYVTVGDGDNMITSPTWTFTTGTSLSPQAEDGSSAIALRKTATGKDDKMIVFPNPSEGGLFTAIYDNGFKGGMTAVHNSIGEIVFHGRLPYEDSVFNLDLQYLKPGIYFLSVTGTSSHSVQKIVIR